jgi:hypothetical protein
LSRFGSGKAKAGAATQAGFSATSTQFEIDFLSALEDVLLFHPGMSTGKDAGSNTFDSEVEADHSAAEARRPAYLRALGLAHANSLGLIVTTSLFFILLASAIMFGGHAAIGPLLRSVAPGGNGTRTGDIVYTMPDGVFCRHMSYDNATGDVTESGVERCPDHIVDDASSASGGFQWTH